MKKIPTIFVRDWNGDRSRVVNEPHPDCGWVFAGEGVATRKLDGTSCMVRKGRLYKRRELRPDDDPPFEFEQEDVDSETFKRVGWMPVGDGPDDKYHRAAWTGCDKWPDGTYELIGPKIQGNPERSNFHLLMRHGAVGGPAGPIDGDVPRTFDGLRGWLADNDVEGIVFHHSDGRMGKIKRRDFGMKRGLAEIRPQDSEQPK